MKSIKKFLKKFDVFGVPFQFKFQEEGTYTTSLGGFFFIGFCIMVLVVGIYYCIPFLNRKNFSIIYYSMNMANTDQIKLDESKAAFAVGLNCYDDDDGTKAEDLLKLDLNYYIHKKTREGKTNKTGSILSTHNCNYGDFYNSYNESFDLINMGNFQCLDKTDNVVEGIYTDETFSYYEFTVSAKTDSVENFEKIDRYLTRNDCRLQLYYTDISIDFNDYKEPIKPYINGLFVQLNPTLFIKMNTYFMNQYFINDDYLLFVFGDEKPDIKTLFSRIEEYSLYRGLNRGVTKPYDYRNYARIYIRADTKKTEITRRYQKVMEFYADASSLLVALFYILVIVFDYINSFYAELALTKKLFFFKDIENNSFDLNKKSKQIKELINLTEPIINKKTSKNNSLFETNIKKDNINYPPKRKENEGNINNLENEEINIYNMMPNFNNQNQSKKIIGKEALQTESEFLKLKKKSGFLKKKKKKKISQIDLISKSRNTEIGFIPSMQINQPKSDLYDGTKANMESINIGNQTNREGREMEIEESKNEKINYNYGICDILISSFFCCCMSKNLKLKKEINLKSNNLLSHKLDISLFVKNMILIDVMNEILLREHKEVVTQFLSRPVISLKKEEKELDKNKKESNENAFDKFYNEMMDIIKKTELIDNEKAIIALLNKKLKELI